MWYIYTIEYNTAEKDNQSTKQTNKQNDILNFAGKWMQLENIILSKITQPQKNNYHMYLLIRAFKT